jgi:vacuolar-type H+-ATPase subunit C/Vma6
MVSGRVAYANARIRSLKSQLFDADELRRLRTTGGRTSRPQGAAMPDDASAIAGGSELVQQRWHQLVRCYTVILCSYPSGQQAVRGLLNLHEIENVKLLWRTQTRGIRFERWRSLWRPLGALQTVRLDDYRDLTSLVSLVVALRPTPYGSVAEAILRSHADDLAACELALDRWASAALASAAQALGRTEAAARDLALAIVRERDLNLLRRGVSAFRLSPDAVVGSLVLLPAELPSRELARLATWTPDEGRLLRAWPKGWKAKDDLPADWDALVLSLKRMRRCACQRAFLGNPFCLAPAIALVLFQEEEVRGVTAVLESIGGIAVDDTFNRTLAASAMAM